MLFDTGLRALISYRMDTSMGDPIGGQRFEEEVEGRYLRATCRLEIFPAHEPYHSGACVYHTYTVYAI